MFLLNLSLPEFLALFSATSGLVVALYLLSRSRRRQVVATLRFWAQAKAPVASTRRRRIQQPWSLILQLLSLALLLLAIAQLKWGDRVKASRDHVVLLDASSWMSATSGRRTLLEDAQRRARSYVRALPSSDRVMLVRADGLPSPATGMESDRGVIERAIDETRPGASALNLDGAFRFAEQIRTLHGNSGGEIIYVGPGRVGTIGEPSKAPAGLRILEIESPTENCGLARIGVRPSDSNPDAWEAFVAIRNYGSQTRRVPLTVSFGGAIAGTSVVDVRPGATENRTFELRTRAAGWVEAKLAVNDALEDDDRAILEIPERRSLSVAVFTADPETIRPALAAHPLINARFYPPAQYRDDVDAQVVVLDAFTPPQPPKKPSVWIEPQAGSPFRVRSRISQSEPLSCRAEQEICAGIRTRSLRISDGLLFAPAAQDTVLAAMASGPVALMRADSRMVALGFNPGRSEMRFDLATPLLMANIMRWLAPEVFRTSEVLAGSVGAVTMPLDANANQSQIRVLADGKELPWTVQGDTLRFYAGSPGVIRVQAGPREQVYSLSLPEIAEKRWATPTTARRGMPGVAEQALSRDLWPWLAIAGAAGLIAEWLLFGRKRTPRTQPGSAERGDPTGSASWRKAS